MDTSGFAFPKPGVIEGRVVLSKRQMQAKRRSWWEQNKRTCHICERPISDFSNYCLDHITPASGFRLKNDADSNLAPAHIWPCNFVKGSKTLAEAKKIVREMFFS